MALAMPLIGWGTPEDPSVSPWVPVNAPTITAAGGANTTPYGGSTGRYRIEDTSTTDYQYIRRHYDNWPDEVVGLAVFLDRGTSDSPRICFRDTSTLACPIDIIFNWASNPPQVLQVISGTSVAIIPLSQAPNYHLFLLSGTGMTPGAQGQLEIYPAGNTVADTGTVYIYAAPVVALPLLDLAVSWRELRQGSERRRAPSGLEDARIVGWDDRFEAQLRYVPRLPRADDGVSGWVGVNGPGVAGIRAMFEAGAEGTTLRFVPDRSKSKEYSDCQLDGPPPEPELERNGDRRCRLSLRSTLPIRGV